MTELSDDEALFRENVLMQLEVTAAAMLALRAQIQKLADDSGIVVSNIKLSEQDSAAHTKLMLSVRNRLVTIAKLTAKSLDIQIDTDTVEKNVDKMLMDAVASKGATLQDDDAMGEAVFQDATVHPEFDMDNTAPEREPAEGDESLDEDILAIFKSVRTNKVSTPQIEYEDQKLRAYFYNPEVIPADPEEFAAAEHNLRQYFRNMTKQIHADGHIDKKLTMQVLSVMDNGSEFDENQVMTKDREIMETISDQGHEQSYFEVKVVTPIEFAEALLSAYSVSVARMRGAYVQWKLEELAQHMEENS